MEAKKSCFGRGGYNTPSGLYCTRSSLDLLPVSLYLTLFIHVITNILVRPFGEAWNTVLISVSVNKQN